tara:strand:+ start:392 stop:1192 length:801 start_codon:yes stop_codon:yes gene_type:complete
MKIIKRILSPFRKIITKLLIEPSMLDSHINKRIWHETNAFRWAASYLVKNQIKGDYLEFGVWKGNSFIEAYNQIQDYSKMFFSPRSTLGRGNKDLTNIFENMRFHAFDSFEGLSYSSNTNKPIQYFEGNYKAEEALFRSKLEEAQLDMSRVTITKGWFNETLKEELAKNLNLKEVAISYIDCDLYEPALEALNFITPYVRTGTILIFDDWFRNKGNTNEGVQGAALKWQSENENIYLQHFYSCDTRTALFIVQVNGEKVDGRINSI